ncbi:MAG: hypothetical protein IT177_15440 [Acidobacteria bacterium]|nr:hypothetical protein [Acidobacteriota bacterium]
MRQALIVVLAWSAVLTAQSGPGAARETALKAAIQAEPGEVRHYVALTDSCERAGRHGAGVTAPPRRGSPSPARR